jgi:RNA recognition motif-containing protein
MQSSKIVVEKLTRNVNEGHLREIFGSYGRIESIDLPLNKQCEFALGARTLKNANLPEQS